MQKKLSLSTETLRALTEAEAGQVDGGGVSYNLPCRTNEYTICRGNNCQWSGGLLCQDV